MTPFCICDAMPVPHHPGWHPAPLPSQTDEEDDRG